MSICRSVQPSMLSLCCSLILSHTLTHTYTHIVTHSFTRSLSYPIELTAPAVEGGMIIATAGRPFSTDCNFTVPENLVGDPTIQWLNSAHSVVVSNTGKLMFPNLLTSHGGDYLCVVNISIPLLKISLTGNGTTRLIVQSMLL